MARSSRDATAPVARGLGLPTDPLVARVRRGIHATRPRSVFDTASEDGFRSMHVNAVHETDFRGFSYALRQGRSAHEPRDHIGGLRELLSWAGLKRPCTVLCPAGSDTIETN